MLLLVLVSGHKTPFYLLNLCTNILICHPGKSSSWITLPKHCYALQITLTVNCLWLATAGSCPISLGKCLFIQMRVCCMRRKATGLRYLACLLPWEIINTLGRQVRLSVLNDQILLMTITLSVFLEDFFLYNFIMTCMARVCLHYCNACLKTNPECKQWNKETIYCIKHLTFLVCRRGMEVNKMNLLCCIYCVFPIDCINVLFSGWTSSRVRRAR